jgi:hypothetical protein
MMIERYPEALKHAAEYKSSLPLHMECKTQCRSDIITRCIELYPQSISIAETEGYLPLHYVISHPSSSEATTLMLIEKYPQAIEHVVDDYYNNDGGLAIHIECKTQCRPSIIAKCIELFPEGLALVNEHDFLPLHNVFWNSSSSEVAAVMVMEKYPAALLFRDDEGNLPIHMECKNRFSPAVISRCAELCPESLSWFDYYPSGDIPWSIALRRMEEHEVSYDRQLLSMIVFPPVSLYQPLNDPLIDKLFMKYDGDRHHQRMILNMHPTCLSSAPADHLQAYHDLNWQPRCSLVHLWLQMIVGQVHVDQSLRMREEEVEKYYLLMVKMLRLSSTSDLDSIKSFAISRGDDPGDHWLRSIMSYL